MNLIVVCMFGIFYYSVFSDGWFVCMESDLL